MQGYTVNYNSISICKTAVTNYFVKTEKGLQARLGRKKCRGKGGWRVIGMASWKGSLALAKVFYCTCGTSEISLLLKNPN